uniref:Uncharacterized protein n=1 Tax=Amphimedon queenslandica TaxID=400682 RepID=A0A1X7UR99_AMPQE
VLACGKMAASIKALRTSPQFISLVNTARIHTGGLAVVGGNWREKWPSFSND